MTSLKMLGGVPWKPTLLKVMDGRSPVGRWWADSWPRGRLGGKEGTGHGRGGSSRSMAGPAPDHLPVPCNLPDAMKGYAPHPPQVIRDLEHVSPAGRENDIPKRHPLEDVAVAIMIADLEPAPTEVLVPPYSTQQLMNGYHGAVGVREMLRKGTIGEARPWGRF
jgi:hypothetical protein